MKILQLIDTLRLGGAERMAVNIANVLSEQNYENVLVVTRANGPLAEFFPTKTIYLQLQKKSSFDFISFYKLLNFIKKEKPTVFHAHSTSIYWGILIKLFYPSLKLIWHDCVNDTNKIILNFKRRKPRSYQSKEANAERD